MLTYSHDPDGDNNPTDYLLRSPTGKNLGVTILGSPRIDLTVTGAQAE